MIHYLQVHHYSFSLTLNIKKKKKKKKKMIDEQERPLKKKDKMS